MFNFQNASAFLFLLLIPLFYLLRKLKIFKRITFSAVLASWEGEKFEWHGNFRKFLTILSKITLILSFVCGIIALSDPTISTQEKIYTNLGADIIFVVDTSPSMAAKDVNSTTRLDAAQTAIKNLIKNYDGYRYGIVTLGSNALVLVPPTNDFQTFEKRIDEIQIGTLGNGSAIGDGISTAVCHLVSSSAPKKNIILLTDGENNAGEINPQTAAELAKRNKISLFIVGLGSKGTVPIEYKDPNTGKIYSGYLNSDFNGLELRKLAESANGKYFESRTLQDLSKDLENIAQNQNVSQKFTLRTEKTHFYKQFVLASIILIIITWILKRLILREKINFKYKKLLIIRYILLIFSFIMMILAYFDFSWGTYLVPVQKNNAAVSFVFDISNSMTVDDCPENLSRLETAKMYSKKILSQMNGTSVSVVLAKGDGVAAIPLTEDYSIVESLIDVLNPNLMTVPGTSLGKGILCAKNTFPKNYSSAARIWVFTDGEETDGQMENALVECVKNGIPVTFVGFGSEEASNLVMKDGKTVVQTAMQTQKVQQTIKNVEKRLSFYKNQTPIKFINFEQRGSGLELLSQLKNDDSQIVSYEEKSISRYKLFLILALLCFAFSFITTEFNFNKIIKKNRTQKLAIFCIFSLFSLTFTSCKNTSLVLKGAFSYNQHQYRDSISYFLQVLENSQKNDDKITYSYALYNLGTSYLMLGEDKSAMEKFSQIPQDAPNQLKYAAFYNAGIISQKNSNYEDAQKFFRKALEVDNSKIDAKINLELSMQMEDGKIKQNQAEAIPISENKNDISEMDKSLFRHIKENDQKQWKNSENSNAQNFVEDY